MLHYALFLVFPEQAYFRAFATARILHEHAEAALMLLTSSQQANGPRAADGRDSPVQETES